MPPKIRLDTKKPHKYEAANPRGRCIVCAYKKKHWLEDKKGAEPKVAQPWKWCSTCKCHLCKEHERDFHEQVDLVRKKRGDKGKARGAYRKKNRN